MKKIIPTQDFVVMEIPERNSSIELPDGVKLRKSYFVTTAIGPDVKKIQIGDRIVTMPQTMAQVKIEDEGKEKEFYIVKEEFIMGIIHEEA